jgi:hypothetical protein
VFGSSSVLLNSKVLGFFDITSLSLLLIDWCSSLIIF